MSTEDQVEIRLLDKNFQVKCPADQRAQLQEAGRYLDRKMREIRDHGRVVGIERIAAMTALNLAYEVLNLKNKPAANNANVSADAVRRLEALNNRVEAALGAQQLELDTTQA